MALFGRNWKEDSTYDYEFSLFDKWKDKPQCDCNLVKKCQCYEEYPDW